MKDYTKDIGFWKRLQSFVSDVQTNCCMGEEEKQMIIHNCKLKILDMQRVSNCKNFDEIDGCECKECGYIWNPYETEHFNFTCCEMCGSDNVDADF